MERLLSFVIGYLIGCVQSAFIVGKIFGKIDIRDHGSGNAGMTNVVRVLGAKAGIFVLVFDILKGALAFNICKFFVDGDASWIIYGIYGGFGAIIGHDFPFYLKFKGGKGTATTIGFMLFISPISAIITYIIAILVACVTKYISLMSLIIMPLFVVFMTIQKMPIEGIIIMAIVTILCYYQHRENIKRLIKKEERKFSFKKK